MNIQGIKNKLFYLTLILLVILLACEGEKKKQVDTKANELYRTNDGKIDIKKNLSNFGASVYNNDEPIIDTVFEDLNSKKVSLSEHKGKIIFLNFWATYCQPCEKEMPSMEKLYQSLKDKKFIMLAVSLDRKDSLESTKALVRDYVQARKLSFPVLFDVVGKAIDSYRVYDIPVTFIISKEGNILGKMIGAHDWASDFSIKFFSAISE